MIAPIMTFLREVTVVLGALLAAAPAAAQDAGVESPQAIVRRALGGATPVAQRAGRAARAGDATVALTTRAGDCYELVGYAASAARVTAQVRLREAPAGGELALTNSSGTAARWRFCAAVGGALYNVRVHTDADAQWSIAVVPAAREASGDAADAGSAGATGAAAGEDAGRAARVEHPIGGTERDYVGGRLRAYAQTRPRLVGLAPAARVTLATNAVYEVSLPLASGACVELVAAGVPSVRDFVIEFMDPTGNRVAQDTTHASDESVRYCAPYGGAYRGRVRVFAGAGLVGVQPLVER